MLTWLAALATVSVLVLYEAALAFTQRRRPERLARSIHATLREEWFAAVSAQKGSEILAVQTLRNSLMSATMTASTAVLGLMGTVTLAAPSLHATFGEASAGVPIFTPRLALELVLLVLLFASLVSSAMAVRYLQPCGIHRGHAGRVGCAQAMGGRGFRLCPQGRAAVQLGPSTPHPGGAHRRIHPPPGCRSGCGCGGGRGAIRFRPSLWRLSSVSARVAIGPAGGRSSTGLLRGNPRRRMHLNAAFHELERLSESAVQFLGRISGD